MKEILSEFWTFLKSVQNKIAFYPSLFTIFGFLLAFFMIYAEDKGLSAYLSNNVSWLVVSSSDTALSLLGACITGLISMMVFSFSMVMVLLNQAANNYSPRLLPGLISNKNHQVILGIYLLTTIYCIFITTSIQPEGDDYQVPGFSVLLGIIFTVISIGAFINFIHKISQNIQIDNILDNIYKNAKSRLEFLLKNEENGNDDFPETTAWTPYYTEGSGYFQHLNLEKLIEVCNQHDLKLHILPIKGTFVLKGIPLFRASSSLNETIQKKIRSSIIFSRGELVHFNYAFAFKQITEIIIKAMSPALNDPGTAVNGIDYLTELFALRMQKSETGIIRHNNTEIIKLNLLKFDDLLYNVMASIRTYCTADIILVQKLAQMFIYLKIQESADDSFYSVLQREALNLITDARRQLKNPENLKVLDKLSEKLNLRD